MKQGPATTNSTALAQLGTSAEWVIACLQTVQNTAQDCQKPQEVPNSRFQNPIRKKPQEVTSPTANRKYSQEVYSGWLNQQ